MATLKSKREYRRTALGPRLRLVIASFLVLFLELALIRWAGSNVVYLSYFTNFILMGSFLGIGIGFLRARAKEDWFRWAPVALACLVGVVVLAATRVPEEGLRIRIFGSPGGTPVPVWLALGFIFAAVGAVMATLGQGLARAFSAFSPLDAYRYDILGGLAGIAGFSLLSFLGAPPLAWGAVVAIGLIGLSLPQVHWAQIVAIFVFLVLLGVESFAPNTYWSPYYKLHLTSSSSRAIGVQVDGIPHQEILSVQDYKTYLPWYFNPYLHLVAPPKNVLVIGAGTGPDVAIALSEGAEHVDAVEIDPRLVQIGRDLNPAQPYASPKVNVITGDGRAFLQRTDTKYDLILFALPDSLTLVTGQSSVRLESYLFTKEAFQQARDHLAPGGVFSLYNYLPARWEVDRLGGAMQSVFGDGPCLDRVGNLATLTVALDSSAASCPTPWQPAGPVVAPATDDRPFPYVRGADVPEFYPIALALILVLSVIAVRLAGGPIGQMRGYLDLFFMGAAFLLLETKNIVGFALLFGTTWFVNALVFGGILVAVFASIEVARRVRFRRPMLLYAALFASLAAAWIVPAEALLGLATVPRFFAAVTLAFAPVFLANLVFSARFRDVESSTTAFGANLLGAMVGGLLEYGAIIVGYRALTVVAAIIYLLALLAGRKFLGYAARAKPAPVTE